MGPRNLGASSGPAGSTLIQGVGRPWRIDIISVTLRPGKEPLAERFEDVTAGAYLT